MGNDDEQPGHLFYVSDGRLEESVYNEKQSRYGHTLRWLKKSSKEECFAWSHDEILRWHNFDLAQILIMCLNPEMAHLFSPFDQNSTHSKPRMDFLRILSNLKRVLCMHTVCKNEPFRSFHTWSRFLANFKLSHVNISCIWYESYDITSRETFLLLWLFEPSQVTSRITIWIKHVTFYIIITNLRFVQISGNCLPDNYFGN